MSRYAQPGRTVIEEYGEAVLCYLKDPWAYFTTQPLARQTGDDWNDAPHEGNAGPPYPPMLPGQDWQIIQIAFDALNLATPAWDNELGPLSVDEINAGAAPWLFSYGSQEGRVRLMGGTPLRAFVSAVLECGGQIYVPYPGSRGLRR